MLDFNERDLECLSIKEVALIFRILSYGLNESDVNRRLDYRPLYIMEFSCNFEKNVSIYLVSNNTNKQGNRVSVGITLNVDTHTYTVLTTKKEKQEEYKTKSSGQVILESLRTLLKSYLYDIDKLDQEEHQINLLSKIIYSANTAVYLQEILDQQIYDFNRDMIDSDYYMELTSCCGRNREQEQLKDLFVPLLNTRIHFGRHSKKYYIDVVPFSDENETELVITKRFNEDYSVVSVKSVEEVWQHIIGSYYHLLLNNKNADSIGS